MEGTAVAGLHFINQGQVKVFSSGISGKEKIVRLADKGHIIGHRGYGAENYPVSAATLADAIICFVDNDSLYELFMTNPKFTYSLMIFYSQELRRADHRAKYNAQMTTRERIISALLYMKEVFGYQPTTNILNVYLQRAEIASLANTTAEDVSRTLTSLEKEKLITKNGRRIQLLNEQKLYNLLEDYNIDTFGNP